MVARLDPLKPLVGGEDLACWHRLAKEGHVDVLFERVMVSHYGPCYVRSTKWAYWPLRRAV